jgi:hypothetical protein
LQGHLRSHGGARPRHRRGHGESGVCENDRLPQARLFLCVAPDCRAQSLICSDCDRGHIYCADCAPRARRRSLHAAGQRYQASRRGRIRHAARSRRYRARKDRTGETGARENGETGARENKVTHHGSPPDLSDALLMADPAAMGAAQSSSGSRSPAGRQNWCCLRCGRRCSEHVRQGFLPRRVRRNRRRGPEDDNSP